VCGAEKRSEPCRATTSGVAGVDGCEKQCQCTNKRGKNVISPMVIGTPYLGGRVRQAPLDRLHLFLSLRFPCKQSAQRLRANDNTEKK
jgi:hypothetical protein